MEKQNIIKKLTEEHDYIIKQIETAEYTIISEVVGQSINRAKALDYAITILKIPNADLDNERNKLLSFLKAGSLQAMPIDILQIVHRLQVLNYINKLSQMEENDSSN